MVQESPVTSGTIGVQVKLNALMELASPQDVTFPCQDVEAILTHVIPASDRVCRNVVEQSLSLDLAVH